MDVAILSDHGDRRTDPGDPEVPEHRLHKQARDGVMGAQQFSAPCYERTILITRKHGILFSDLALAAEGEALAQQRCH